MMKVPTCAGWCDDHRLEEDIDGSATDLCRRAVTVGASTVDIEDSPDYEDLPIIPPNLRELSPAGARDLAAALIEAARLVEDGPPLSA